MDQLKNKKYIQSREATQNGRKDLRKTRRKYGLTLCTLR